MLRFALLVALVILFHMPTALADEPSASRPPGPVLDTATGFHVTTLASPFQARPMRVEILLPAKLDPGRKYPVLYILPVGGKDFGDGLVEAKKADLADKLGLICVSPSFSHTPWYGNHATDPHIRQEDFVVQTLVPYIDNVLPTQADAEGRWLVGFSKSGWGAFTLLMRHPKLFGYAAAWDVPFMIDGRAKDWGPMGLSSVMGTPEQMQQFLPTRLAADHVSDLKPRTRLVLGVGDFWKPQCIAMHDLLTKLEIPHSYLPTLLLKHRWDTGWFEPTVDELASVARKQ